ncbi:MAG: hypothetical protein ACRDTX_02645 [Pseudonocardiaceae bacterium]
MSWYLRSLRDGDTHRGELQPDGVVEAQCGLRFELPKHNYPGLPGEPPYPEQVCRKCKPRTGRQ